MVLCSVVTMLWVPPWYMYRRHTSPACWACVHVCWAEAGLTMESALPWCMSSGGRPLLMVVMAVPAMATAPATGEVAGPRLPGRYSRFVELMAPADQPPVTMAFGLMPYAAACDLSHAT